MDKNNLNKLIGFVIELSKLDGNEWFNDSLIKSLLPLNSAIHPSPKLDDIYEYCIRKILKDHADKFYSDIKLLNIKDKLIEDFIRMEKFRREDNFEDFCLATFQQLESLVSELIVSTEFLAYFRQNQALPAILKYDSTTGTFIRRGNQTIGKLTFQTGDQTKIDNYLKGPIQNWFFNHKFRAVLYFYYFNKEVKSNTDFFDRVYETGIFLYQGRNLNHRGAVNSEYQQGVINDLLPNQHKYYFKFLGFLEDVFTTINRNIG